MTTEVKVCGLTREEDVALACELGASFVGFNFVASSPRRVTLERARRLAAAARALCAGVFAGEDDATNLRAIEGVPLDLVQLHRPVRVADVETLPVKIIAAVPVEDGLAALPPLEMLPRLAALLWDSSRGAGRPGDWDRLPKAALPVRVFLAGGLDADNVGDVIRRVRPSGVDVASGVESAPGIKDPEKLRRFLAAVREADRAA